MSRINAMSGIVDEAPSASRDRRPTVRSRVLDDQKLELSKKEPQLYKVGQDVYVKVGRRVNPAVHQIHKALGDGQYELRHATVVQNKAGTGPEIYLEENLQLNSPPPRFKADQTVYVKGERGMNPTEYKIHKVLGDGKYQLSEEKDGKLELELMKDGKTPKEYEEDSLGPNP